MKRRKKNRFIEFVLKVLVLIFATGIIFYSGNKIQNALYPIKYEEIVLTNATEYGVDPFLIYAIIKVESSFNETAVSNKDARGLMQIMPTTAAWIAKKLKIYGHYNNAQ